MEFHRHVPELLECLPPQGGDYSTFRPTVKGRGDGVVQPYADSPLDEERLAENVYRDIIDQSRHYVYIFTPYLAIGKT